MTDLRTLGLAAALLLLTSCATLASPPAMQIRQVANAAVQLSDQKSGSLLVYPFYGSDGTNANDTRLTITHVGPAGRQNGPVMGGNLGSGSEILNNLNVHLLWIDSTCSQADGYICLTKFQSWTFKASDWDPATKAGYLIAVSVDPMGFPIAYDGLIGSAFVNCNVIQGGVTERWLGAYSAESFAALGNALNPVPPGPVYWYTTAATPNTPASSAALALNNGPRNGTAGYDAAGNAFAVEFQSVVDSVGQTIVVVGLNGVIGGNVGGNGFGNNNIGVIYRNDEKIYSWTAPGDNCILMFRLSSIFPRIVGGMAGQLGTGRTGTLVWTTTGGAVGLFVTPQAGANRWSGIRGLHKRNVIDAVLVVPVFMPSCVI